MSGLSSTWRMSCSLLISMIWPVDRRRTARSRAEDRVARPVDGRGVQEPPAVEQRLGIDPRRLRRRRGAPRSRGAALRAAAGVRPSRASARRSAAASAPCGALEGSSDAAPMRPDDRPADDLGAAAQRLEDDVAAVDRHGSAKTARKALTPAGISPGADRRRLLRRGEVAGGRRGTAAGDRVDVARAAAARRRRTDRGAAPRGGAGRAGAGATTAPSGCSARSDGGGRHGRRDLVRRRGAPGVPALAACSGCGSLATTPSSRRIDAALCLRGRATG